jgi:pimeloyl-ACP methyl ester carboxylesterase
MSRPALVLSSSLGTDQSMWEPLVPLLEPHFDLLAYDMRGHGSAPSPPGPYEIADLAGDVIALLDEREIERMHWAGVSIGGMIVMWTAAHAPERIDRLVVCCSSPHMPPPEAWEERIDPVPAPARPSRSPTPSSTGGSRLSTSPRTLRSARDCAIGCSPATRAATRTAAARSSGWTCDRVSSGSRLPRS